MKKFLTVSFVLALTGIALLTPTNKVGAKNDQPDARIKFKSYIFSPNNQGTEYASLVSLINKTIIPYSIGLASIGAVLMIAWGGMIYVVSGSSSDQTNEAKQLILGALLGLAVVVAAGFITKQLINKNHAATTPSGPANQTTSPANP